ncbi:MAG TPA: CYTH domain-containing protein [Kiritimatiellia bacterium]|nr:CYTH domain-containing protein [Kiritimatiellia bacterium]
MGIEIERKFLVQGDAWRIGEGAFICQGYLSREIHCTIRIRVAGNEAFLTIKGSANGIARAEFEYPIPLADAKSLLAMCDQAPVEKIRREIVHAGMTWEVDEFLGVNAGLVIAELELESEDQPFERPDWLGAEVTGDPKYYNANLVTCPYSQWEK